MDRMLHCTYWQRANRRILQCNNKKKRETPWSRRALKGDDSMAYAPSALAPRDLAFTQTPARTGPGLFAGCSPP